MRTTGKTANHLEEQVENFLQELEALWQYCNQLPRSYQQTLLEAREKFSLSLQKLPRIGEELSAASEVLSTTCLAMEAERWRYQELFEFAPTGYLVTDGEAVILDANQAVAHLLRVQRDRLVGQSLLNFIPQSEHLGFRKHLKQLQHGSATREWETHLTSEQGELFPIIFLVGAARNSEAQVVSLRWLLKDITKCKQRQAALHRDRQRLKKQVKKLTAQAKTNQQLKQEIAEHQRTQALLQRQIEQLTTELGRVTSEPSCGNEFTVQHHRATITRTAELEVALNFEATLKRITDKVRDSLDESQILQTAVQELVRVLNLRGCNAALYDTEQTTATISYEYNPEVPAVHGQVVPMNQFPEGYYQLLHRRYFQFCELLSIRQTMAILACPIVDNQRTLGDLWLFKHQEETFNEQEIRLVQQVASQCAIAIRQARLYQEAQAQVLELEKLNRLKDEFLSTISHEFRTPVSNMKMAIQMLALTINREIPLMEELAKPPEEQSKLARYFQILQNECEREINLINDFLDLQRLDTPHQSFVLVAINLPDWLPRIVEPFIERSQKRQQTLCLDISPSLPPFVCNQANLERIVTELLNNACKYTPSEEKIIVSVCKKRDLLQLSVSNTGVEIPENEIARIFDKFYRIPSIDPWKQGGTGLGLALVKKLVTDLGGIIQVESENGQTCFTVTLPI